MAVRSEVLSGAPAADLEEDRVAALADEWVGGGAPVARIGGRPTGHRHIPRGGVTPDELRNTHLREAFRGYHRDHVDALCERAAETIEHLERRVGDLEERLRHVLEHRSGGEAVRPSAARRIDPGRDAGHDVDVVQRTLELAQQAADEAVAEAQVHAHRTMADAERTAAALVAEAESTSRRIADEERTRYAAEVADLGSRRRALRAEVEVLEQFTEEYRNRVRRAIESELGRLGGSAVAGVTAPPRPLALDGPPTDGPPEPTMPLVLHDDLGDG